MLGQQFLTPDHQLYLEMVMFLTVIILMTVGYVLIYRKQDQLGAKFSKPVSILRYLLNESRAHMKHPHEFAKELDELLDKDAEDIDAGKPINPKTAKLIAEREVSTDPNLRKDEAKYAALYLIARPLLVEQEADITELTGLAIVGSVAPEDQSPKDAKEREKSVKEIGE